MKTRIAAIVAALITLAAGVSQAGIYNTAHNLSNDATGGGRTFNSVNETQICIFCHTPHNATQNQALWNRLMPTQTFDFYTSGISQVVKKAPGTPGVASLRCLSCHDGRSAINVVHNARYSAATRTDISAGNYAIDIGGDYSDAEAGASPPVGVVGLTMNRVWFEGSIPYGNIGAKSSSGANGDLWAGTRLSDDHPISISYDTVVAAKPTGFNTTINAATAGVKFYPPNNQVECSSCHDPHFDSGMINSSLNDASKPTDRHPFLRVSKTGSQLCLACHIK